MTEQLPSDNGNIAPEKSLWETVDEATRTRAGSLSAHGLNDYQIADILLLTYEQVVSVKESLEYKKKYAEVADKQIETQLTLGDAWDAVEEEALKKIITTLSYNSDPKYALAAAQIANKAERRRKIKDTAPVIDASKSGGGNTNIIVLKMNRNFINVQQGDDTTRTIDTITVNKNEQPRRISDMPNPKQVQELLQPAAPPEVIPREKRKILSELEKMMDVAGVALDINDDD